MTQLIISNALNWKGTRIGSTQWLRLYSSMFYFDFSRHTRRQAAYAIWLTSKWKFWFIYYHVNSILKTSDLGQNKDFWNSSVAGVACVVTCHAKCVCVLLGPEGSFRPKRVHSRARQTQYIAAFHLKIVKNTSTSRKKGEHILVM